VIKNTQ